MIAACAPTMSSIPAWPDRCQRSLQPHLPGVLCRLVDRQRTYHRPLAEIERMMDALVRQRRRARPCCNCRVANPPFIPQIIEIIEAAKRRPIRHVMLNTNGIRIAQDPDFVAQLASFKPGFEVYLQFDSLRPAVLKNLRGADLTRIRREALRSP